MIEELGQHNLTKSAGVMGRFFRIDPVLIGRSTFFEYAFRAAAFQHAQRLEQEAQEREAAKIKAQQTRR